LLDDAGHLREPPLDDGLETRDTLHNRVLCRSGHSSGEIMEAHLTDLETLERQTFRRFYDDGLLDLLLGLMLIGISFASVVQDWLGSEAISLLLMVAIAAALVAALKVGRAKLLKERLGRFTPAPQRRRKITMARLVLLGSMVVGVAGFALGAVAGTEGVSATTAEIVLPLVWFVNATVVMGLAAYLLDVPRFALYGLLFGMVGPLLIWPDVMWDVRVPPPLAFGIPAVPIVCIGLWKLMRFLKDYPVLAAAEDAALNRSS
jgi:hypothetical protein